MSLARTCPFVVAVHSEDVYFARWTSKLLSCTLFFYMLEQHIHVHTSCLAAEWATLQLQVQPVALPPMLVPSLVGEDARTFLASKSCVVEHILDHIDDSYFFKLSPTMRAMSIAATLPLVNAALTCKYFTLTATDHILHHISTDWADELLTLLLMLFDCVIYGESFRAIANFIFDYALDLRAYICYKFNRAFLSLSHLLCDWCYAYPCQ